MKYSGDVFEAASDKSQLFMETLIRKYVCLTPVCRLAGSKTRREKEVIRVLGVAYDVLPHENHLSFS